MIATIYDQVTSVESVESGGRTWRPIDAKFFNWAFKTNVFGAGEFREFRANSRTWSCQLSPASVRRKTKRSCLLN